MAEHPLIGEIHHNLETCERERLALETNTAWNMTSSSGDWRQENLIRVRTWDGCAEVERSDRRKEALAPTARPTPGPTQI